MSDDPNDRHGYSQPTRAQYDALRAERDAALARLAAVERLADRLARSGVGYDAAVAAVIREALGAPGA